MKCSANKITKNRAILCESGYEDSIVFENPDYDEAIVGVTLDGNVVYDYSKMIGHLMVIDGMSYEEAQEFIDYNTVRALPYIGKKAPIIMIDMRGEINGSRSSTSDIPSDSDSYICV